MLPHHYVNDTVSLYCMCNFETLKLDEKDILRLKFLRTLLQRNENRRHHVIKRQKTERHKLLFSFIRRH